MCRVPPAVSRWAGTRAAWCGGWRAGLPFEAACLPRAMAAQWMLLRRGVPSRLVFGARRPAAPGGGNDYHAWLTVDGERVIGGRRAETYRPLPLPPPASGRRRR